MIFGEYSTQIEHIADYESSDDNDGMVYLLKICPIFVGSASLHFTKYKKNPSLLSKNLRNFVIILGGYLNQSVTVELLKNLVMIMMEWF